MLTKSATNKSNNEITSSAALILTFLVVITYTLFRLSTSHIEDFESKRKINEELCKYRQQNDSIIKENEFLKNTFHAK